MLFNSIAFAIFLPVTFALYWLSQRWSFKAANIVVIVASYFFYGLWDWRFLGLIFLSTVVDYAVGRFLERTKQASYRKALLVVSLLVNFGILAYFKYAGFFVDSFQALLQTAGVHVASDWTLNIILPVGISFYTFQTVSYTIDVYRKKMEPTRSFIAFMAYVAFFPQLVAGPIERAIDLLPQFLQKRVFNKEQAFDGARQMLWGFFKKIAIADTVAPAVNTVFSAPGDMSTVSLLWGVFLFGIQIYADFSGYSDIAIGAAKLFGIQLSVNFRAPYFATSPNAFWRRWHITLMNWFREYIYFPLGGSRKGLRRNVLNVMIVFTVSGLWHGAAWHFVVWGVVCGLALLPQVLWGRYKKNKKQSEPKKTPSVLYTRMLVFISWAGTMLVVFGSWILFRSESIASAGVYYASIFRNTFYDSLWIAEGWFRILPALVVLFLLEWRQVDKHHALDIQSKPFMRWCLYLFIFFMIIQLRNTASTYEFIYFAF